MSVIRDVLQDEYNRLNSLLDFYEKKISEHPKGSIQVKKRGYQFYSYQVYRDHQKVKYHYIGKEGSKESKDFSAKMEKRHQYEQKLKESKVKLEELSRLLRVAA